MASLDGSKAELDRLKGDVGWLAGITARSGQQSVFCWRVFSLLGSGLELAVDGYVGVLVEAGIGLHAGFGLLAAFEDLEVVVQEAEMPLEAGTRGVVFEGVGLALSFFDEFAVGYTGSRPSLGKVVGVELEDFVLARIAAHNDMFAAFIAVFDVIHGTTEVFDAHGGLEVAYSTGVEG